MRILLACLLSLLLASCATSRKEPVESVEIEAILPRYMAADQFKRIGEYLTGRENTGDRIILRSQEGERSGFYFTLVLDEKVRRLPKGTVIVGEFHTPKSPDAQTHRFELPSRGDLPGTKEVFVGLTGSDWTFGDQMVPSAWRFTIEGPNGGVIARQQSYLWSL